MQLPATISTSLIGAPSAPTPQRPAGTVLQLHQSGLALGRRECRQEAGLVVHPASRIRLLWVWSVTRGAGPGWGGCDDAPGARVERGGGAQAGADDALTEAGRGTGSPGADHSACG